MCLPHALPLRLQNRDAPVTDIISVGSRFRDSVKAHALTRTDKIESLKDSRLRLGFRVEQAEINNLELQSGGFTRTEEHDAT